MFANLANEFDECSLAVIGLGGLFIIFCNNLDTPSCKVGGRRLRSRVNSGVFNPKYANNTAWEAWQEREFIVTTNKNYIAKRILGYEIHIKR